MPTYDYRCKECGHVHSEVNKIADRKTPKEEKCPECGGAKEFAIGTPAISYQGGGHTDHRPEWFKDRLREVKKHAGRDNVVKDHI